jgi:two-component system, sensor histidine kinase
MYRGPQSLCATARFLQHRRRYFRSTHFGIDGTVRRADSSWALGDLIHESAPSWPTTNGGKPIEVVEIDDALDVGLGSDILIVDDNPATLVAHEAALDSLGRRCVLVESGDAAMAKLLEQDFALILLDIGMPGITGIETARLIRERPRNKNVPIIFITGEAVSTKMIIDAYETGAYDFLVKPVLPEVLRAKASLYLRLQERTRTLASYAARLRALEQDPAAVVERDARLSAEAVSKRKDDFLAMLGHELRNPLAAMVTAFDLVKKRGVQLPRELDIVDRQLKHLTQIVNDLVDVARVTRGTITLRREAVQLQRAIDAAIELARPVLDQHGHELIVDVAADLIVDADPERIAQVLANLLSNAAKYTPGRGRIEITAQGLEDRVRIAVRDNGVGIAAPLLATLFDAFVQGERALDRHLGGLGVGLTLVRTLVELHGGTVEARSDGAGMGATFTVDWPHASGRTITAETPIVAPPSPLKILLVDDNQDAAEVLAALLELLGHEVVVAYDGIAAVDKAREVAPDLAIVDIGLPGRDGYGVAQEVRALENCAHTTLVALTGYGLPEDRARAERAGFAYHQVKPIEMKTLAKLLARIAPR